MEFWWYCVLKRISQTRLRGYVTDGSGERLNGIQEVSGSIPLISTKGLESNDSRPFSLDLYDFD